MFNKKITIKLIIIFFFCCTLLLTGLTTEKAYAASSSTTPNISSNAYTTNTNVFTKGGFKGQCTWFVWGRTYEKLGIKLDSQFYHNAKTWWNETTYKKGQTPAANSIAVFSNGSAGHVVFVESVVGDTIYFNEANYHKSKNYDGALEKLSTSAFKNRSGSGKFLGFIYLQSTSSTTTEGYNATLVGDFAYVRDANGNIISGKTVGQNSSIKVLSVNYDKQLASIQYKTTSGVQQVYIRNASIIKYTYQGQWKNGKTKENVYDENGKVIGYLNPGETATPLYRKNGKLYVVYNTSKGANTKSGFVNYNGGFSKF